VKVSPRLALQRSAAKVRVGRAFELAGSVAPSKAKLALVVERKVGRRYVRLFALGARASAGSFNTGFRPRISGLYRLTAQFAGDRFNSAGTSPPVFVRAQSGAGGGAPASR